VAIFLFMEARLIARREGVDAAGVTSAAAGGTSSAGGKLRHRYILKPVDATARLALSVDPSDR